MIIRHRQSTRHGFGEPPSIIDLSHAPPAKGNSLCLTGAVRLDPRQLAVLAKGCVRTTFKERIAIDFVYSGVFSIDSEGRIWRHYICRHGNMYAIPTRRAEWVTTMRGEPSYLAVYIRAEGRNIHIQAHRLVWQFFHGDIPDGLEPNHIDGDKRNNRPGNLELVTFGGNRLHSYHVLGQRLPQGEINPFHKLTNADVLAIRELRASGYRLIELGHIFGISETHVSRIVHRQAWPHLP